MIIQLIFAASLFDIYWRVLFIPSPPYPLGLGCSIYGVRVPFYKRINENSKQYYCLSVKNESGGITGNGNTIDPSYDGDGSGDNQIEVDQANQQLVEDLNAEIAKLDPAENKHAIRLLKNGKVCIYFLHAWSNEIFCHLAEVERINQGLEPEYLEVDIPKSIRIVKKVKVPIDRNPKVRTGHALGLA